MSKSVGPCPCCKSTLTKKPGSYRVSGRGPLLPLYLCGACGRHFNGRRRRRHAAASEARSLIAALRNGTLTADELFGMLRPNLCELRTAGVAERFAVAAVNERRKILAAVARLLGARA